MAAIDDLKTYITDLATANQTRNTEKRDDIRTKGGESAADMRTRDDAVLAMRKDRNEKINPLISADPSLVLIPLDAGNNTAFHLNADPVAGRNFTEMADWAIKNSIPGDADKQKAALANLANMKNNATATSPAKSVMTSLLDADCCIDYRDNSNIGAYKILEQTSDKYPDLVKATDSRGNNLVHLAKDIDRLNKVTKGQVDVDQYYAKNLDNQTPVETVPQPLAQQVLNTLKGSYPQKYAGRQFDVKAMLNEQDGAGNTSLGRADSPERAALLLNNGADSTIVNKAGKTQYQELQAKFAGQPGAMEKIDAAVKANKPAGPAVPVPAASPTGTAPAGPVLKTSQVEQEGRFLVADVGPSGIMPEGGNTAPITAEMITAAKAAAKQGGVA